MNQKHYKYGMKHIYADKNIFWHKKSKIPRFPKSVFKVFKAFKVPFSNSRLFKVFKVHWKPWNYTGSFLFQLFCHFKCYIMCHIWLLFLFVTVIDVATFAMFFEKQIVVTESSVTGNPALHLYTALSLSVKSENNLTSALVFWWHSSCKCLPK